MGWAFVLVCVGLIAQTLGAYNWPNCGQAGEVGAANWLTEYNQIAQVEFYDEVMAEWNYNTDITESTIAASILQSQITANFSKEAALCARQWQYDSFPNELIKREMGMVAEMGPAVLNADDYTRLNQVISEMESTYSVSVVCNRPGDTSGKCYPLDPDLTDILATSTDWEELQWAWDGWRSSSGFKMIDNYEEMVQLLNKAADMNGYEDNGDYWRSWYEDPNFRQLCEDLWLQLRPLYQQLHAYVRRKLEIAYPENSFPADRHIPAHLLGNMWAQSWVNIEPLVRPYPDEDGFDVTDEMVSQGYRPLDLFTLSEEFFTSLGLIGMPAEFWMGSMITKPDDRDVVCHASAWDFYNQRDFRIKQCTEVNMNWLITTHHEMGHVEYFLQYKNQPVSFRNGANPGFHEAIGDVMSLSVSTPQHLKKIGLAPLYVDNPTCPSTSAAFGKKPPGICNEECSVSSHCASGLICCSNGCGHKCMKAAASDMDINFLMGQALKKIAFIPFGYLIDQWRWDIFAGLPKEEYNERWWNYRCKYQGISPPSSRTSRDFDGGAKFHVPSNVPYIRYFISYILQFHFHKHLCAAAGWEGPLYACDIYESTAAGDLIGDMMKMGASKPWPDALEAITGSRTMSAEPLVEYFKPLLDWLAEENAGYPVGWDENSCPVGSYLSGTSELDALIWRSEYDRRAQGAYYTAVEAEWMYATNITNENTITAIEQDGILAEFEKETALIARSWDYQSFVNPDLKREFGVIAEMGASVLPPKEFTEMSTLRSEMESIYSTAKVCNKPGDLSGNCYPLDPDLTEVMATSRDWDELVWAWDGWRQESGAKMPDQYEQFTALLNQAADMNGYEDNGDYWRSWYEDPTFRQTCEDLWNQILPLYQELHQYVRTKLKENYTDNADDFPTSGHIPAHLLGNMWAQQWGDIEPLVRPTTADSVDVSEEMRNQNYDATKIFEVSEEFFTSLGLIGMPQPFWDKSMIVKPTDREVVCHASAWDFYNQVDFRIKQCTEVDQNWLSTTHHEMGHIEYYLQYKDQPVSFRNGANPGFHEAIGDVMSLSVNTPAHLNKIGLLPTYVDNPDQDLNFLMSMALDKIAFLPFGYLIDQWRWDVFDNTTTRDTYNQDWWAMRCKYQGLSPPVPRRSTDFDPGAKYHVPANTPYIRYFVSHVLQFQFHKSLCEAAGHTGPLYKCDIYQSTVAGKLIGDMMKLGSSVPWQDALEAICGTREMSAEPLVEYFQTLIDWLKVENVNASDSIGWDDTCPPNTFEP